jgi:hypothetical protein
MAASLVRENRLAAHVKAAHATVDAMPNRELPLGHGGNAHLRRRRVVEQRLLFPQHAANGLRYFERAGISSAQRWKGLIPSAIDPAIS